MPSSEGVVSCGECVKWAKRSSGDASQWVARRRGVRREMVKGTRPVGRRTAEGRRERERLVSIRSPSRHRGAAAIGPEQAPLRRTRAAVRPCGRDDGGRVACPRRGSERARPDPRLAPQPCRAWWSTSSCAYVVGIPARRELVGRPVPTRLTPRRAPGRLDRAGAFGLPRLLRRRTSLS
jgi:hypothetical protein